MASERLRTLELDANVANVAIDALRRDGKHIVARRFEAVRDDVAGVRLDATDMKMARDAVMRLTDNEPVADALNLEWRGDV